jgi:hypothetical protein
MPEGDTPVASVTDVAVAQGKRWSDATASIRARTDLTAKLAGSLGTLGITAAGLSKFSDVFPLPADPSCAQRLAIVGVLGGLIAMAVAVACFTARLWKVSAPLFMSVDPDAMPDLDDDERPIVQRVYGETAVLNGVDSLSAYAARGARFERIAQDSSDDAVRKRLETDALQVRADVDATQARAATNVIRGRAKDALSGVAYAIYALFVIALLAFGVGADYLDSERAGRVASAKSCAGAVKAVRDSSPATAKLIPTLCGGRKAVDTVPAKTVDAKDDPTPQKETAAATKELGARYAACVAAAKSDASACVTLREALQVVSR